MTREPETWYGSAVTITAGAGSAFPLAGRAEADRAGAGAVDRTKVLGRGDDLPSGREVGAAHVLAEIVGRRARILEEPDAGRGHLAEVVGRDVRGHPDRDARGAVEEHRREAGGEQLRLLQRAVEIGPETGGALPQLVQEHPRERGEPRLGVAHGREGPGVVGGPPVALPVDEGITDGEGLGHEDHRLVAGGVPMRVELPEHVAHRARRLLESGPVGRVRPAPGAASASRLMAARRPKLRHRVHDPALHRLQAVRDVGQRPVEDDVHGVVEVRLGGELAHRPFVGPGLRAFDEIGCHVLVAPRDPAARAGGRALAARPAVRPPPRPPPPRATPCGHPRASWRAGDRGPPRCRPPAPRSAARGGASPATWSSRGAGPGSSPRAP